MELRIEPEASDEERRAVEAALAQAERRAGAAPVGSAWRRAAIRENVADDDPGFPFTSRAGTSGG